MADPFDIEDAIFQCCQFFIQAGVREGNIEKAIYHYNHSNEYVQENFILL